MSKTQINLEGLSGANATDIFDTTGAISTISSVTDTRTDILALGVNSANGATVHTYNGYAKYAQNKLMAYFDFAKDGGAQGDITLRGAKLPKDAVITGGYWYVTDAFTSGGSATIALGIPTDDPAGILAATAIGTAGTVGGHDIIQDGTGSAVSEITTEERELVLTVGTADLTAGSGVLVVEYDVLKTDASS